MSQRVLIAGVGNIFFGDDGYGCEVIRRMANETFPQGVRVEDYGIRGTHLAFELMSGYDAAILIDAVPKGGDPGTLYVIEPDLESASGAMDAHSMDLQAVFAFMRTLEGVPPRIIIVGCEPASAEDEIGLTKVVEQAVGKTIPLVREVLQKYVNGAFAQAGGST
ncbi:MAG: hydrogenase maturation protease [Vulcanimicrobiaceae bacterium]